MKTNDNIPEELLLLIEQKPFDMLTIEEVALVVQHMTAEEYRMMQESIAIANAGFADTSLPRAGVGAALQAAYRDRYKAKPTAFQRIWNMPVGLGRVAAVLLVAIIATAFILKPGKRATIVYRYKTDTVFVAQEVPPVHLTDTVYITKVKYSAPAHTTQKEEVKMSLPEPMQAPSSELPLDRSEDRTTGTRMDEDEISKFFSYVDGCTTPM